MAHLYTNPKGYPVRVHSYSAGSDFNKCKRLYKLKKLDGWKSVEQGASMEFGNALEEALRCFHKGGNPVEVFTSEWTKQKGLELKYTDKEGGWGDMLKMGQDMMTLYPLVWKKFGYSDPVFQLNFKKEVFPESELSGINFTAYIDMKATREEKPVLIDIKTASSNLDNTPNLYSLDPQLRSYAWVTGVPDVAFLWFVKMKPDVFKKGDIVHSLLDGEQREVLEYDKKLKVVTLVGGGVSAAAEMTKQRIQFVTAHISDEDIIEAGEQIGQEVSEIVYANAHESFPKEPGVRFPNQKCQFCEMLPICTNNEKLRDKTLTQGLVQIKPRKSLFEELESE